MPTFELRAASAAAWMAVKVGATTISTSSMSLTRLRNSFTYTTASWTVLCIFQLPAINGCLMSATLRSVHNHDGTTARRLDALKMSGLTLVSAENPV
jgi:hypothetical protein